MHSIIFTLSLLATLASTYSIKVQHYYDGGCTSYATEFWPFTNFACYDYQWGGANSANIAWTDAARGAVCTYYAEGGCRGAEQTRRGGDCASNWGGGFKSVRCGEYWPDTKELSLGS